ncbi:hypothetical protein [Natronococcus sp.]|uniref:hypothetical protein n=1 Tax=Natronococcus sp. TaxID=35747 RepID=UPI0025E65564|nr:hypothetical protein [Natronococcus sp.]
MSRDRRDRTPGRRTRPAYTRKRQSWYGYGTIASLEKSRFGCFLHDLTSIFGEVSIIGLPVLLLVGMTDSTASYGVTAAAIVAWLTMVLVGTLVRGGWVRPLGTETLGWLTFSPALIALRFVHYNTALAVASYGGVAVAVAVGVPPLSVAVAVIVGVGSMLALPAIGESIARSRRQ